jgi:hypothetical protein
MCMKIKGWIFYDFNTKRTSLTPVLLSFYQQFSTVLLQLKMFKFKSLSQPNFAYLTPCLATLYVLKMQKEFVSLPRLGKERAVAVFPNWYTEVYSCWACHLIVNCEQSLLCEQNRFWQIVIF